MKYAIGYVGGVGDALLAYLREGSGAGHVAALREREPGAFVRCAFMPTSPAAAGLFDGAAPFDEVISRPWDGRPGAFGEEARDGFGTIPDGLPWSRPGFALDAAEAAIAADLEAGAGFVAVHPFAGTQNRVAWGRVDFPGIVRAIVDSGLRAVILGASGSRRDGIGEAVQSELTEVCDLAGPGVVNLVGVASIRLQAHLATRARRFVGAFSAFYCAAHACGIPSFILAPWELRPFFGLPHPAFGRIEARVGARIAYFGEERIDRQVSDWLAPA